MKHRLVPNRLLPDLFSKGMKSSCVLFTGASTSNMEKISLYVWGVLNWRICFSSVVGGDANCSGPPVDC